MILLDIVLSVLLIYGFYKGFKNGFFVEIASVFSFVVGIYLAFRFSKYTEEYLAVQVTWSSKTVQITAFIVTFLLVVLLIRVLAKVFTEIADFAFLGLLNSFIGAFIGFFRMALYLSIILSLLHKINTGFIPPETNKKSILLQPISSVGKLIFPFLEKEIERIRHENQINS